jgi:malonyl-CoA O-methyltransferase
LQVVRQNYERFRQDDLLPATYEIIYGHAWKPVGKVSKELPDGQQFVDFQPR